MVVTRSAFAANDKAGHTLAWGHVARGWMLENPEKGLIRTYPNLVRGLSELERVSGQCVNSFVTFPNPY